MSYTKRNITLPVVQPRDYQVNVWKAYEEGYKNIVVSYSRRFGKDLLSLSIAVSYAMSNPNSSIVLLAPHLVQAKKIYAKKGQKLKVTDPITGEVRELTGSLLDICIPKAILKSSSATEGVYTLINGSTISLLGSSEDSFIGMKINFLVISEAASHKHKVFGLIGPVMEESGGITLINGTVTNEDNFLWDWIVNNGKLEDWYIDYLPMSAIDSNYYLPPKNHDGTRDLVVNAHLEGGINKYTGNPHKNMYDKVRSGISKSLVIREYLNIPTDIEDGSFYSSILSDLRRSYNISNDIEVDYSKPVHTAMDLGVSDDTVITWFQVDNKTKSITVIDCYSNTGETIDHYINVIESKPYPKGLNFAPHDATNRSMVSKLDIIDIARTEYGFTFHKLKRSKSTLDDINVVRDYLARASFIAGPCVTLLKNLESYHAKPDGTPKHDRSSNFADSYRYVVLSVARGLCSDQCVRSMLTSPQDKILNVSDATTPRRGSRVSNEPLSLSIGV